MKNLLNRLTVTIVLSLLCASVAANSERYSQGSTISGEVAVVDASGGVHKLRTLLQEQNKPINVVFIFGGGGMGHEHTQATGGLWCPDSFEDLHILRSLKAAYGDEIGMFAIAVPAAHHMASFGFDVDVFVVPELDSTPYKKALVSFVESTQQAFDAGTIPVQPLYDAKYNFMISPQDIERRESRQAWHGAFRAEGEQQTYGVPSLWVVGEDGRVLREPFRGNDYHGHGKGIRIEYTLADVVAVIDSLR